jgi:hypothetical protein
MSFTLYESLSSSYITQAYKAFVNGRATTITSEKIRRLESIGMIWDAQKGGNRKRKTCEGNDDVSMISHKKTKLSLSNDQNENTSKTMSRNQDHQQCRETSSKNIGTMDIKESVKDSVMSSRDDSRNKNQALKISRGPVIKNNSTSLLTKKHIPLLYPRSAVKECPHKTSKIVDASHEKSEFVQSDFVNPPHSKKLFTPKLHNTRVNRLNDYHPGQGSPLGCSNVDATSESGNQHFAAQEIKKNYENINIGSLPLVTELQNVKSHFRDVDTEQSTPAVPVFGLGCSFLATKSSSDVLLVETLKAGRELTTHMSEERIEEVYLFLEAMKWRSIINALMELQNEISSDPDIQSNIFGSFIGIQL